MQKECTTDIKFIFWGDGGGMGWRGLNKMNYR